MLADYTGIWEKFLAVIQVKHQTEQLYANYVYLAHPPEFFSRPAHGPRSAVLIITASHQTFSGQFWYLSGQNKFDLTHLLYIINVKVSVFLEDKVMSGQISTLIISTGSVNNKI